ncbi:DUF4145 domain-containing protein [Pseudoalteromonas sp. GABNS16A]|uniref:DUF4145 domain-containing protein n=2 Tax=unclassified Pseudoalteromonas TaxID=194690 RepID=UPI002359F15E|nr:DUF4145 domain-containing protein [Pseudoalteromonas sp. GABNS16A]MDC9575742.1 DUF4145 domain-containing protein [Pseudoalteromonas sp. GABNS16A]
MDFIPITGKEHFEDMRNNSISNFSRANAARRYAEMVLSEFIAKDLRGEIGEKKYNKLKYSEVLSKIRGAITPELKSALEKIKVIGDKGSHYSRHEKPTKREVDSAIKIASEDLIPLTLHNYFSKNGFFSIEYGPKIFSTLPPSIRESVLRRLIDFRSKKLIAESNLDKNLLHRYVMACHKSGNREKIRRRLRELKSKSRIDGDMYRALERTISNFDENSHKLPIPKTMEDSNRNFNAVLSSLDYYHLKNNNELISIIKTFLHGYSASEMGNLQENVLLYNEYIEFEKI